MGVTIRGEAGTVLRSGEAGEMLVARCGAIALYWDSAGGRWVELLY
jgi:hypothetical protein